MLFIKTCRDSQYAFWPDTAPKDHQTPDLPDENIRVRREPLWVKRHSKSMDQFLDIDQDQF